MKQLFAVWTTGYDSEIQALFTKREYSEAYGEKCFESKNDYSIHPIELDPLVDEIAKDYRVFQVLMRRNGDVEEITEHRSHLYLWSTPEEHSIWERTKAEAYKGTGQPDVLSATVWAKDEKHAIKIVDAIRKDMLAKGTWK